MTLIFDDFNREDSPEVGPGWVQRNHANMGIRDGKVYAFGLSPVSGQWNQAVTHETTMPLEIYSVETTIVTDGVLWHGVLLGAADDDENAWIPTMVLVGSVGENTSVAYLYVIQSGWRGMSLGGPFTGWVIPSFNSGDKLGIVRERQRFTVYINGVALGDPYDLDPVYWQYTPNEVDYRFVGMTLLGVDGYFTTGFDDFASPAPGLGRNIYGWSVTTQVRKPKLFKVPPERKIVVGKDDRMIRVVNT